MLLRSHGKVKKHLSFHQQLSHIKKPDYTPIEFQKSAANFQIILNVLDLLINKSPKITQQIFILKKSITKWYDHIKEQNISKIREVMNLKEGLVIRIKKQIGIVLEQIAYYLRSIVQDYKDSNMEIYYVKYLNALKKLEWDSLLLHNQETSSCANRYVQTQEQCFSERFIGTLKSIDATMSIAMIESPTKKYKDLDIQKYFEVKEDNLELQRRMDQFKSLLASKEQQNKKLKMEIERLIHENDDFRGNEKKYLLQVNKLTANLSKLSLQAEQRQNNQKKLRMTFGVVENKYQRNNGLRDQLYKQLNKAESQIARQQMQRQMQNEKEQYFGDNFKVIVQQAHQFYDTIRKQSLSVSSEYEQANPLYYMLLTQAIAIQDTVINPLQKSSSAKTKRK